MPSLSFAVFRSAGFRFGSPLLISILMILALEGLTDVLASYQDLLLTLPYILFTLVVLLSQPFNQGRTGLVSLLMMVAYYIIQNYLQEPLSNDSTKLIFIILASLLPLNLLQIHIMPDKRLWSRFGVYFILFIALQIAWAALVVDHFANTTLTWLWETYLYTIPTFSPLPLILILLAFSLTCSSAATILKRNFGSDQTVYISLLFSSLAFVLFQYTFISSTAFSLAATLLLLNIITCSHELAFVDQLTNIPGRRALETELKNLGRTYTLAMLDIDHFKKFNDDHGHKVGDDVLKLVAKIMQQTKGGAQIFRYGGEEFTILFKGKEASQCQDYLEQLRIAISKYDLVIRAQNARPKNDEKGTELRQQDQKNKSVHITVSIGLADSFPDHNPENVLKAADEALYKAKNSGRNRVAR